MSSPLMDSVLDREVALSRVGGDAELLKEIAVLFLGECPKILEDLHAAAASGDARRLERTAHALKGSVSNFGAGVAVEAARSLEAMGRAQQLAGAAPVLASLEQSLNALSTELAAL